ncbi:hypothetical protein SVAN01_06313 [Stagonosporopsis vannaccii]|nr:hypothetical protein SVAN01_06313 [Stagonosporopsis vannaccii]
MRRFDYLPPMSALYSVEIVALFQDPTYMAAYVDGSHVSGTTLIWEDPYPSFDLCLFVCVCTNTMETSDYFERALFHDRSREADDHYESSAGFVFEEHCEGALIEVRTQSCRLSCDGETKASVENHSNQQAGRKERASDSTEPAAMLEKCSDHCSKQTATAYDDRYLFVHHDEKSTCMAAEGIIEDNYDACSISNSASSTALNPAVEDYRKYTDPPLYPGLSELTLVWLAPDDIEQFVHQTKNDFRVFYIRQRHSHSRLQITKMIFERLLSACHVFPRFTEYVTGLCAKTSDAEVGPPPLKFRPLRSTRDKMYRGFECCYILRYVELTKRGRGRKPWSLRQFAVYHRYKPARSSPCSTWIMAGVLQCTEKLLDRYTQGVKDLAEANPFELHMIFLDRCITNWRPYLAHLARLVQEQSGKSSGFTLSGDQSRHLVTITVEDHQQLKEIEDDVADLVLCLDSSLDTLASFVRMYEDFSHSCQDLHSGTTQKGGPTKIDSVVVAFKEKAQEVSYTRNKAESLLSKIQNTRNLVSSLLERQSAHSINQQIGALHSLERQAQQENKSMRQLTEKSSRDSSSMRILTIITMIYLPCTIVSNFFSTQFVNQIEMDTGGLTLEYAQNTWLFFAISVPLTIFTILVWFVWVSFSTFLEHRNRRTRHSKERSSDEIDSTDIEIKTCGFP